MQDVDRALDRLEPLEQDEERDRHRLVALDLLVRPRRGDERLRQPVARVGLAPDPRGAQVVDREPRHHRGQERLRRAHVALAVQAEIRLLHEVLGLAGAAHHPQRDREHERAQRVGCHVPGGHLVSAAHHSKRRPPHAHLRRRRHRRHRHPAGPRAGRERPRRHRHDPLGREGRTRCAPPARTAVDRRRARPRRRARRRRPPPSPRSSSTSSPRSATSEFPRDLDRAFAATNRLRTEGTEHLLAAALAAGARRIVAQSFAGWPAIRSGGPVKTEADPFDPDPVPSMRASLDAIKRCEELVTGAEGIEGIALRYGGFYGPGTGLSRRRRAARAGPQAPLPGRRRRRRRLVVHPHRRRRRGDRGGDRARRARRLQRHRRRRPRRSASGCRRSPPRRARRHRATSRAGSAGSPPARPSSR